MDVEKKMKKEITCWLFHIQLVQVCNFLHKGWSDFPITIEWTSINPVSVNNRNRCTSHFKTQRSIFPVAADWRIHDVTCDDGLTVQIHPRSYLVNVRDDPDPSTLHHIVFPRWKLPIAGWVGGLIPKHDKELLNAESASFPPAVLWECSATIHGMGGGGGTGGMSCQWLSDQTIHHLKKTDIFMLHLYLIWAIKWAEIKRVLRGSTKKLNIDSYCRATGALGLHDPRGG